MAASEWAFEWLLPCNKESPVEDVRRPFPTTPELCFDPRICSGIALDSRGAQRPLSLFLFRSVQPRKTLWRRRVVQTAKREGRRSYPKSFAPCRRTRVRAHLSHASGSSFVPRVLGLYLFSSYERASFCVSSRFSSSLLPSAEEKRAHGRREKRRRGVGGKKKNSTGERGV